MVVTRDFGGERWRWPGGRGSGRPAAEAGKERRGDGGVDGDVDANIEGPVVCGSLEDAIHTLQQSRSPTTDPDPDTDSNPAPHPANDAAHVHVHVLPSGIEVDRIFIIGGAQLYASALSLPVTNRILLTSIDHEYACDTFFPLDLFGPEARRKGWVRRSGGELRRWTGEEGEGEWGIVKEEKGVRFEFGMFERE